MIEVTRINGQPMVLNCDLIESVEAAPDTIIRLVSGKTIIVKETVKEIVEEVVAFKSRVMSIAVIAPNDAFEDQTSEVPVK